MPGAGSDILDDGGCLEGGELSSFAGLNDQSMYWLDTLTASCPVQEPSAEIARLRVATDRPELSIVRADQGAQEQDPGEYVIARGSQARSATLHQDAKRREVCAENGCLDRSPVDIQIGWSLRRADVSKGLERRGHGRCIERRRLPPGRPSEVDLDSSRPETIIGNGDRCADTKRGCWS